MGKVVIKNGEHGFEAKELSSGSGIEIVGDLLVSSKLSVARPLGEVQRSAADAALTIGDNTQLMVFASDVSASRDITLPVAEAGKKLRLIWEVEQDTDNRVLKMGKSGDVVFGNLSTLVAGDAAGDGDVVPIPITTVQITIRPDVNIGSYLDLECVRDGVWYASGILVLSAVGVVPQLA